MQASIDSAKRRFDIDITAEIQRIKKDMDVDTNKYPKFWGLIKRGFDRSNINNDLKCPMNSLAYIKTKTGRKTKDCIQMEDIMIPKPEEKIKRLRCRKVEELIERYQIKLLNADINQFEDDSYLLLRSDFDVLINDIRQVYISRNYQGLMFWLLDRVFYIEPSTKLKKNALKRITSNNKPLLMKVLYEVSPSVFLSCFKRG